MTNKSRTSRAPRKQRVPGQLELALQIPQLTDDQRAELAAYVAPGWAAMAACRSAGDDTWFPAPNQAATCDALTVCADCPVRRSCLAHALTEDEEHGIWGGTTPIQRDLIRQQLGGGQTIPQALDQRTAAPPTTPTTWRQAS